MLLAALSLPADTPVTEVLGGAPAALDQMVSASPGTLVIGADDNDLAVGAAAALTGDSGATVTAAGRQTRSLPLTVRAGDGVQACLRRSAAAAGGRGALDRSPDWVWRRATVAAVAGVRRLNSAGASTPRAPSRTLRSRPQRSSGCWPKRSSVGIKGLLIAVEQSSISAAELAIDGPTSHVFRDEIPAAGAAEDSNRRRRRDPDLHAGLCARVRAENSLGGSRFRREPGHRLRAAVPATVRA